MCIRDRPGWAIEFARLDALGMRILPVPRGPDGPDLAVMARLCELHAPKPVSYTHLDVYKRQR